ncbi:MAG: metallophosphoesterase family protein [Ignisphaera sp.]
MRILIVSDIHGNAEALRSVLESVDKWDAVWFLGDFVDYGPEPHIVIDIVKDLKPDAIVMGNHDYAVAFNTDCKCDPVLHNLSEYTRKNISLKLLSREQIEWLKTLPKTIEKVIDGKKHYIVHGSPRNPLYGYIKPGLSINEIKLSLTSSVVAIKPKPIEVDYVFVGHTHIPMDIKVDSVRIVNPGSCGQPRDGDYRASYAIYDTETNIFEIGRIEYDIERVVKKLEELNLESGYSEYLKAILKTGRIDLLKR